MKIQIENMKNNANNLQEEIEKTSKISKSVAKKMQSKQSSAMSLNKKAREKAAFDPLKRKVSNKNSAVKKPKTKIINDDPLPEFNMLEEDDLKPNSQENFLSKEKERDEVEARVWKIFDNFSPKKPEISSSKPKEKEQTYKKNEKLNPKMHDIDDFQDFKANAIAERNMNYPISYKGVMESKKAQELIRNFTPSTSVYSKAAYRLIAANVENLTEKLVDDLLYEMVFILNSIESDERSYEASKKQKDLLYDFLETLNDYVYDSSNLNKIFIDQPYKYDSTLIKFGKNLKASRLNFISMNEREQHISLTKEVINEARDQRVKVRTNQNRLRMYGEKYIKGFFKTAELLIDEELQKMALEIDEVQSQAIETMIKEEFK